MTTAEKLVTTAYTEVLMVDMGDFQKFSSNLLETTLFTHDFAMPIIWNKLKESTKDWFLKICEDQFTKEDEKVVMDILEGKKYE